MNKNTGIIIGVVALVIVGVTMYFSMADKDAVIMVEEDVMVADEHTAADDEMVVEDAMMVEDSMMSDEEARMMQVGSYEVYTPEKVVQASDSHNVVLFFKAAWCPSCRTIDTDIKANLSQIPESLTILDVDYDNSTELKKKYGVTYQHTFVQVDKDGNLVKKWSGGSTLSDVVAQIK